MLWFLIPLLIGFTSGLGAVWTLVQTGAEEQDLVRRLPEYAAYMKRVPRFVPRLKRAGGGD